MQKVLVVVDMQNAFIDGALGSPEAKRIVPLVKKKIEKAKSDGTQIVFTRDTHTSLYLHTQEGQKLPIEHCIEGTKGHEIHEELKQDVSIIFDKPTFGSLALANFITDSFATEIELCGLCTDICVISNALLLKAFLPEAKISVDSSCCAGTTPQNHENALSAMAMCQIDIKGE